MSGDQGGAAACERIVNDVSNATAVGDHLCDQLDWFGRRMQLTRHRPIDFEHRVVAAVAGEVVRAIFDPTIKDRLVSEMIVTAPDDKILLHPHEAASITEPAIFETGDEIFEIGSWNRRVDDRSGHDREKLQERLAKLAGGVAVIRVGGATEVEVKERKDRVDDAMHATRAAVEEGILPGGGVALLRSIKALGRLKTENHDQKTGIDIVRRALNTPARQIAVNAGEDGSIVVGKISENESYVYGFDAQEGEYGDLVSKGIIDPTKVVRTALQGAASIAGLLMTTEAMVAEKPKKESPMPAMPPGGGMDY